jgi:excisionase family DNA binding protein
VSGDESPAPPAPLGERLLRADEVAAFLGCDRSTVYRLAGAAGGLPVVEIAPRVRRFRPQDVRAFVAARTASPAMAVEARNLLDSLTACPPEVPGLSGREERLSRLARAGKARARRGDGR